MPSRPYTPIETAILKVLANGERHLRQELLDAIDSQATPENLANHLVNIRKVLRPLGEDIICEYNRRQICYRWVRLISQS